MSDLLKSIDKAQLETGNEKKYKIEGWCVFKDKRPYTIQVRGDRTAELSYKKKKIVREDVAKALKDPSASASGFSSSPASGLLASSVKTLPIDST